MVREGASVVKVSGKALVVDGQGCVAAASGRGVLEGAVRYYSKHGCSCRRVWFLQPGLVCSACWETSDLPSDVL